MHESHEKLLGYWMHRIGFAFKSQVDTDVEELGIRGPDAMIMLRLAHEGSSTLVELSKMIGHAHTSILRNIDNLEELGYVERSPHPNDRRVKIVTLTEKGDGIVPQIIKIISRIHAQALSQFTDKEKKQLFRFLRKIHYNLTGEESVPQLEELDAE